MQGRCDPDQPQPLALHPAGEHQHRDDGEADREAGNAGGFVIWVAIADVAHYVTPGSALDREARKRGNSVYFPDRVVPMLPERISNDLCSLREKEERPALACYMSFDKSGRKTKHRFERVIAGHGEDLGDVAVGKVEHDRAIGGDAHAPVTGHLHDRGDPARRTAGDDDEVQVAGGQPLEGLSCSAPDGAVGEKQRPVEIARDEPHARRHRDGVPTLGIHARHAARSGTVRNPGLSGT